MTREEETKEAYKDYMNNGGMFHSNPWFYFKAGTEQADKHPKNVRHDPNKEIKELIIQCVDKCAEYEMYPKDIFNEIYKYIDKWYKDENQNNL